MPIILIKISLRKPVRNSYQLNRFEPVIAWAVFVCVCDIRNNQGRGKHHQPRPSASGDNTYLDLDYFGHHKTESNNCLYYTLFSRK